MHHSPIRKPLGTAIMLVLAGGANSAVAGDATAVAMDSAGNSVVAWQDNSGADGDASGIFARRYDVNSMPTSAAAFQVNTTAAGAQQSPVSAMAASGESIVVWQSTDEGGDSGIYAQRYVADGTAIGSEFRVNSIASGIQQNPTVAMNASGDFVVAWEDALAGNGGMGIMARIYQANGNALTDALLICVDGSHPSVAMADNGSFSVSWNTANGSVQMQRFAADGSALNGGAMVAAGTSPRAAGVVSAMALVAGVDVGLGMSAGASGNTVTYNVTATNYGDTASGAVSVVDTLPGGTSLISASGSGWSCGTPSGGTVTCNLASLAAGANSTVTIKVDATGASSTSLTNSATATTSGDVNTTNNSASKTVTTTGSSGGAAAAGAFGWVGLLLGFLGLGLRRRGQGYL